VPIEFWVAEFEGEVHSYMMLLGMNQQDVLARELHAMVVDPLLPWPRGWAIDGRFFCAHYKHRALTRPAGPIPMQKLLLRGFADFRFQPGLSAATARKLTG
jgi:hypothetical protein